MGQLLVIIIPYKKWEWEAKLDEILLMFYDKSFAISR